MSFGGSIGSICGVGTLAWTPYFSIYNLSNFISTIYVCVGGCNNSIFASDFPFIYYFIFSLVSSFVLASIFSSSNSV